MAFLVEVTPLLLAKDYGLKDEILEKAKSYLDTDSVHMEEVLKSIYDDKREIEEEKVKILQNSREAQSLKEKLKQDTSDYEEKATQILEDAKFEAKQILLSAKEDANEIIRQLEHTTSSKNANQLRNTLNEKISKTTAIPAKTSDNVLSKHDIHVGDSVTVLPLKQVATVLAVPNKSDKVEIQVGSSKMYFPINQLAPATPIVSSNVVPSHKAATSFKAGNVASEIKLLGTTVEEATVLIDKYLDDAYLAGLSTVRIVHGKGTGALRTGIHAYLKRHPHVKSFRLGTLGEGDMGVTVVEIK